MSSKIVHHFQLTDMPWVNDLPARYVKGVNPPIDNPWPGKIVFGRWFMEDGDANALIQQRERGAEEWYRRQAPFWNQRRYVSYWELPNEPVVDTLEQCDNLAAFTKRAAYLAHADGYKVGGGNLAQGTPGGMREYFLRIVPGLQACDLWDQHCYYVDDPRYAWHKENGFNEWHALRIVMNHDFAVSAGEGLPPAYVGEGVIDFGVVGVNDAGYRELYTEDQYMAHLARYDQVMAAYPWIWAVCVFTAGPIGWLKFETTRRLHELMQAHIIASGGPYVPSQTPVEPPAPPPTPQPEGKSTMIAYSQRDPRWAKQKLGTGTLTIGKAGCAVTACAAMLTTWGNLAADPAWLNTWLIQNGGYYDGDLLIWRTLAGVGARLQRYIKCEDVPAPVDDLRADLAAGRMIIAEVDFTPGVAGGGRHWVLLHSLHAASGHTMDPWPLPGGELASIDRYLASGWNCARAIYAAAVFERAAPGPELAFASAMPVHQPTRCVRGRR